MIRAAFLIASITLCLASLGCSQTTTPSTPETTNALGAVADGKTKDTAAIQKAIDECAKNGGGVVNIPPGNCLIGSIELKSNTTLHLEEGAHLLGSPDLDDYPIVKARWEGRWVDAHRGLIFASGANHIAITGPGKITGDQKIGGRQMPRRPCVIEFINCTDILLEDFSAEQQKMWTIHPTVCENLVARRLTLRSKTGNGDGIDVDSCRHVLIEYCDIDTGDDCIALKSGRGLEAYKEAKPTEDVLISHCKLGDSIFACIGVGSETSGGVHNVQIEDCEFTHANTYSIYIKSHVGRGASIENISATNLIVDSAKKGFLRFNLIGSGIAGEDPVPGNKGIPLGRNFSFSDVHLAKCGAIVDAYEISPVKPLDGLTVSNITGDSDRGITLVNMTNVALTNINVKTKRGALVSMSNVTGSGLDNAEPYKASSTMPSTKPSADQ